MEAAQNIAAPWTRLWVLRNLVQHLEHSLVRISSLAVAQFCRSSEPTFLAPAFGVCWGALDLGALKSSELCQHFCSGKAAVDEILPEPVRDLLPW